MTCMSLAHQLESTQLACTASYLEELQNNGWVFFVMKLTEYLQGGRGLKEQENHTR